MRLDSFREIVTTLNKSRIPYYESSNQLFNKTL